MKKFKHYLEEASFSRINTHLKSDRPVGMMTAFRGTYTYKDNKQRNKKLEQKKEEEKERLSSNQMAKEVVGHINQKIDIPHIVNIHDTPPTTEVMPPPIFERRQERGLHEGFVKEKQYEAKLMAKIDKELERDEQV